MHDTQARTLHRLQRLIKERIIPAIRPQSVALTVEAWEVPGEPVPFEEAASATYSPFTVPSPWGRPWGTTWFKLSGQVPDEWPTDDRYRAEVVVDLGFTEFIPGFQAEGSFWTPDGKLIKGLEPHNDWVPLQNGGSVVDMLLEAAHNPIVPNVDDWTTPTHRGDLATAGDEPLYTLRRADICLRDLVVWELHQDLWTLLGLHDQLPPGSTRKASLLAAFEDVLAAVDPHDVAGTAGAGRAVLSEVLAHRSGDPSHTVHAVGHAHIDSAWLWPVRETRRKCARTFSNVLTLMEQNDEFTFACSSAQQYAWIKEDYPELFERIAQRVAEGRFIPVGGMWVESDTNMPGGEALVRQFVEGTQFFQANFGVEPLEVWLPDSFGYTAAMPQIARAAGKKYFLTQKISWNDTNTFPHHSFDWEGIDGTRILTHFPPSDTYNSVLSGEELARSERQNAEKGRNDSALLLFGFGDGGGGPTREMLAAAERTADLAGSPRVQLSSPATFFEGLEASEFQRPIWSGEMYLEYHRGTYTSQHRTKAGNRRCEGLLREAELWATTAALRTDYAYPQDRLRVLWRKVLLLQFHDILPGTSIAWVAQDAENDHASVAAELEEIIAQASSALVGEGDVEFVSNASPFVRRGVAGLGISEPLQANPGTVRREGEGWVLENASLRAVVDQNGEITSLRDVKQDREVLVAGMPAGRLHLFTDVPNEWDAWDINHFYAERDRVLDTVESIEEYAEDSRAGVTITRSTGPSTIVIRLWLDGDDDQIHIDFDIDWHEEQKLLKMDLPFDVHAREAVSEIQFGHIHRPTHANTSWDQARFETVAHRWVHVGEPGYGVAVANLSTYGHDISRIERPEGGAAVMVRPSLLRAPKFPDPGADQGSHHLEFSIRPGAGLAEAVEAGYDQQLPLRAVKGARPSEPLFTVGNPAVVIEAVKMAEDGSGDVIVRLYESLGTRARSEIRSAEPFTNVVFTDLLERELGAQPAGGQVGNLTVELRPFEIMTLRYSR